MHFMPRSRSHTPVILAAGFTVVLVLGSPGIAASHPAFPAQSSSPSAQQGASGSTPQPNAADAVLVRAIQLHQSGHFEEAIREYRLFLKEQPESFIARANLGAALAHEGRYVEAITEYNRALKVRPGDLQVELNLALAHYKALELDEAARELVALNAREPANLNIALLLGDCYFRLGEYKKAVALLGPFETDHPEERALIYLYGMSLIRDGQVEKGEVEVNKILSHGNSPEAHLMLGAARLAIYDNAGAIDELSVAIKLNPKLPIAHYLYGRALLTLGHREEAMKQFREELAIDPNEFDPNLYLGVLLNQSEEYKEAAPYLTRALQVRPGDPAVRFQMAIGEVGTGSLEQARKMLEGILKDSPDFLDAHVSLAQVYYRLRMKAEGDRERTIIARLNAEKQAREQARGTKATQEAKGDLAIPGHEATGHGP
jgi:tetratricopeptide (TPR) repeat protein